MCKRHHSPCEHFVPLSAFIFACQHQPSEREGNEMLSWSGQVRAKLQFTNAAMMADSEA